MSTGHGKQVASHDPVGDTERVKAEPLRGQLELELTPLALAANLVCGLVLALLTACTPTPPRFGNFGGPVAEQPAVQPAAKHYGPPPETDWFPVQARFHPDGKRLVLNFCHADTPYYCRMVQYDRARQNWALLPNQQADTSYFRPSYSNDGKTLVFSTAPCSPDRKD